MEAIYSSEILVPIHQITCCNIPTVFVLFIAVRTSDLIDFLCLLVNAVFIMYANITEPLLYCLFILL